MTNENVAQLRIGALFVTVTAALGGLMTGSLSPLRTRNTNFGPSRMGIGTDFVGESQMKSTSGNRSKRMVLGKRRMSELFLGLLLAALARLAFADCRLNDGQVIYPQTYPLSSVTSAVQHRYVGFRGPGGDPDNRKQGLLGSVRHHQCIPRTQCLGAGETAISPPRHRRQ